MATRLPIICISKLRASCHNAFRNSGVAPSSCVSCASLRNSSTFLHRLRTSEHILAPRHEATLVQTCEKSSWKSPSKKKASTEYDSGSDSDEEDFLQKEKAKTEGVKVVQIMLDNVRVDGILKHAFGIARNKIEVMFYENLIRVNGKKPTKKSANVNPGDEVDLIKGTSSDNTDFIVVSRVEVLRIRPSGDYLAITIRKQRNMTIENYEKDPWIEKSSEETTEENKDLA